MRKGDIILFLTLFIPSLVCLLFFLDKQIGSTAFVYVNGELFGSYDLSEDCDIVVEGINGISDTLRIRDKGICMTDANCPDKVCVSQGRIFKEGQSICCAPAGILVVIDSDEKAEYDAITQ